MDQNLKAPVLHLGSGQALVIPGDLVCPYCDYHRPDGFPGLRRVTAEDTDKGQPGDLVPACAKSNLSAVAHWQGHHGLYYPNELNPLRLFKCRHWFWIVVPGLRDDCPQHLLPAEPGLHHAYYRRVANYTEDPHLTAANLLETHVFVREVRADSLDAAYHALQGENWSPNGEARELIAGLGLTHTSISVGDVLAAVDGLYEVGQGFDFRKLPEK
ncbi:MAG: hypothetical protein KJ077_11120 [Anaerolineae bacterium]|nr:hypothetical protein [Anaerolineae bacterium]